MTARTRCLGDEGPGRPRVNQANDEGVDPDANMWAQLMQKQLAMQQQYQDQQARNAQQHQQIVQMMQQQIRQPAQTQQQ